MVQIPRCQVNGSCRVHVSVWVHSLHSMSVRFHMLLLVEEFVLFILFSVPLDECPLSSYALLYGMDILGLMQCLTIMGESSVHVLCPFAHLCTFSGHVLEVELPGLEKTGVQFYLETAVQRVCACPNYCQQCKATVGLFYKF